MVRICTAAALMVLASALAAAGQGIQFTDVTVQAGVDFIQTIGDDEMSNIIESAGVGCALVDYDGDGWLDIYLVSGYWREDLSDGDIPPAHRDEIAKATDRLYRNRGDGTFEDVTVKAGVARTASGMGVIAGDYDGDGNVDLYVTNFGPNFLYRNNGDGTFDEVAVAAGVDAPGFSAGAVFLDYDRDGRLDLYVGNYVEYDPDYSYYYAPDGFPGPLAFTGSQDRLYRGSGDGTFSDVTEQAKLVIEPVGRAMGVGSLDYNNDGFVDVFVSNDAMENYLLRNLGDGTFSNEAWDAGVAFGEAGDATAAMAVEVADWDGDGFFDVCVPDLEYSCLYRNTGEGYFVDRSAVAGIAASCGQYDSWGCVLADFDLDGHVDLYIANGDVHHLEPQEDLLFRGDGQGGFVDVSEGAGNWARTKHVSRGVAAGDIDNDGDIDLLVASLNDRPVLLRNDTPRAGRHWVAVRLVGGASNRDAIGAVVKVTAGDLKLMRQRVSGGSYLCQHDTRLFFGLGENETVESMEIVWPDGSRKLLTGVAADAVVTVRREAESEGSSGP
jgi:hypothetical protein